ncbi:hypothetical protein FM036_39625 [Nostoc sp. HG1]|nr:hypothetical protein [Nostoc sp. HG1]
MVAIGNSRLASFYSRSMTSSSDSDHTGLNAGALAGDGFDATADGELISRLRVIEEQPLDERASAYGAMHESLSRTLEPGHAEPSHPNA